MTINPTTLKTVRERKGLTRQSLEEIAGGKVTARTIMRIENGQTPPDRVRRHTVEALAKALGVTVTDLAEEAAEATRPEQGHHVIRGTVDGSIALAYDLIENHYGVSQQYLIRTAPLFFHLLAEMSLERRRERLSELERLQDQMLELSPENMHLPDMSLPLEFERESINKADVFGRFLFADESEKYEDYADGLDTTACPFTDFIESVYKRFCDSDCPNLDLNDYYYPSYSVLTDLQNRLVGRVTWQRIPGTREPEPESFRAAMWQASAYEALSNGFVRLKDIPPALLSDERCLDRCRWIVEKTREKMLLEHDGETRYDWLFDDEKLEEQRKRFIDTANAEGTS